MRRVGPKERETKRQYKQGEVARALWAKINHVKESRKETLETVAAHWGVPLEVVLGIRDGHILGTPALHDRIAKWMFEKVSFRKARALKVRSSVAKAERWPVLKVELPKGLKFRLEQKAAQLNMSASAFIQVAVERLLEHEPTIVTIRQALELAEGARVAHLMQASPALKSVLEADIEVIDELGVVLEDYNDASVELTRAPFAIQDIMEATVGSHGAAVEVFNINDEFEQFEEVVE